MSNPSMPQASQPWRPRAQQQNKDSQQQPPAPASKGGRGSNNAGFETDGQIRERTNARGQSHAANAFAKYGSGKHNNNNNNVSNTNMPVPTSQNVVAPVSSAVTAQKENQFNIEDALDAFENIKVHPIAKNVTDWAPVAESGVTYEPCHKNVASFLKMCKDAQEKK